MATPLWLWIYYLWTLISTDSVAGDMVLAVPAIAAIKDINCQAREVDDAGLDTRIGTRTRGPTNTPSIYLRSTRGFRCYCRAGRQYLRFSFLCRGPG